MHNILRRKLNQILGVKRIASQNSQISYDALSTQHKLSKIPNKLKRALLTNSLFNIKNKCYMCNTHGYHKYKYCDTKQQN